MVQKNDHTYIERQAYLFSHRSFSAHGWSDINTPNMVKVIQLQLTLSYMNIHLFWMTSKYLNHINKPMIILGYIIYDLDLQGAFDGFPSYWPYWPRVDLSRPEEPGAAGRVYVVKP